MAMTPEQAAIANREAQRRFRASRNAVQVLLLRRRKSELREWADSWAYGPRHVVPCPSFAPGVAAQLAAALSGKGGETV